MSLVINGTSGSDVINAIVKSRKNEGQQNAFAFAALKKDGSVVKVCFSPVNNMVAKRGPK